jgi:hypothetical protein
LYVNKFRGISSFGRAAALQAVGDQFDPGILHQTLTQEVNMPKSDETLKKAYGNIPKEIGLYIDFSIPVFRGLRYYLLKFFRKFTR